MRVIKLFLILISISNSLSSMHLRDRLSISDSAAAKTTKNTVFLEVFGTGAIIHSLNYERIFFERVKYQIAGRIGFGYQFENLNSDVTPWSIPFQVVLSFGTKHHLETGLGFTYLYGLVHCTNCGSEINRASASSTLYSSLSLGYKYKKPEGHLFFNFALTPLFLIKEYNDEPPVNLHVPKQTILPYAGIGCGYSFKFI
ncbi:MAG: hypothetical protein K0Q95_2935 [Bacteroidota bacterium]|jgi:hypothetical protein|nr:hypothetical protein [Bacteroidota bacterium]